MVHVEGLGGAYLAGILLHRSPGTPLSPPILLLSLVVSPSIPSSNSLEPKESSQLIKTGKKPKTKHTETRGGGHRETASHQKQECEHTNISKQCINDTLTGCTQGQMACAHPGI